MLKIPPRGHNILHIALAFLLSPIPPKNGEEFHQVTLKTKKEKKNKLKKNFSSVQVPVGQNIRKKKTKKKKKKEREEDEQDEQEEE